MVLRKRPKIFFAISVTLILFIASFFIFVNIDTGSPAELAQIQSQLGTTCNKPAIVEGVEPYTQPDPYTCAVTAQSIIISFLTNKSAPPESLIEKYGLTRGMKLEQFIDILAKELPDYEVYYQHDKSDLDMIQAIQRQLSSGIPVPVFLGTPNPYNEPYYDFHASVVTSIDLEKQEIGIVNPYGYLEQISLMEFLDRMSYRGIRNYPLVQRVVLKLGLMDRNSIVLLTEK